ncbi:TetR/AcrR family transcriptional regulator [Litorivita sp. NS0012-18]|uniref:TetR/AcrR family transcriptional regulator n=1 Tax=Litorivita sp. NS0012-18 TaxID=3127655 RepID=UPI0031070316
MTRLDKITRLDRQAEAKSAKRLLKKEQLAESAVNALKQLGYARTSLRDIAQLSGMSVGTLHYYFEDKVDLIGFCVQRYKTAFIKEMEANLYGDAEGAQLVRVIGAGLAQSIRREAETHRLWYDIRAQAMFDPAFRDVVDEIETALIALVGQMYRRLKLPPEGALPAYLMLDAGFRFFLQRHLSGDAQAVDQFEAQIIAQLDAARAAR